MTSLNHEPQTDDETTIPRDLEAAITELADRCNSLPPQKQAFLADVIRNNSLELEVIDLLVLMLENSDDDFNITSPELNELIAESQAAVHAKENL
ncbi:hypothetical protein HWD94_03860 [Pseudarthrobacter equi]|uniref:hypothetical protein n=1 Tax=Pseudarthrobacter equi TaxID=728066 RepID=UPI0021C0D2DE|nr:hypothetical protein [Pseudarthrobacter equi]MCT9624259.1 hypothetical protein [Pseudarthrobacter equi]